MYKKGDSCKKVLSLSMKTTSYRLQKLYNLDYEDSLYDFITELFDKNNLKFKTLSAHCTKYEYDDSDFTAFVLFYGEDDYSMQRDKDILNSITYEDKPVFGVSGNGWGTGLSVTLNTLQ